MKRIASTLLLLSLAGCREPDPPTKPNSPVSLEQQVCKKRPLAEARQGFQTRLTRKLTAREPVPVPPPNLLRTVSYRSTVGDLAAYVSVPPSPSDRKHPAIIWVFGGFSNSIGVTAWEEMQPDKDESARAFREAGIVMMYPSLRGGNENPGVKECFLGEVDDIVAAAKFLASLPYVDSKRIYLGGHSTGGTLALLAAASTDRFRAVFSFGPVDDVRAYGAKNLPFDASDDRELELRSPLRWMHSIERPTFVFEGMDETGNVDPLHALTQTPRNPMVHVYPIHGANHISILTPVTRLIADKILHDNGPHSAISFTEKELDQLFEN